MQLPVEKKEPYPLPIPVCLGLTDAGTHDRIVYYAREDPMCLNFKLWIGILLDFCGDLCGTCRRHCR